MIFVGAFQLRIFYDSKAALPSLRSQLTGAQAPRSSGCFTLSFLLLFAAEEETKAGDCAVSAHSKFQLGCPF